MTNSFNDIQITEQRITILKGVGYLTGGLAVFIMLLLIINFIQLKTHDPLELESLEFLLSQHDADSQNEALKDEIRSLDLLARQAFFTKAWQLKTGGILLLAFIVISLVSFRMVNSLKFRLELPGDEKKEGEWQIKSQTRNAMVYIGIFLAGLVLVVFYFSDKEFQNYLVTNTASTRTESLQTKTSEALEEVVQVPEQVEEAVEEAVEEVVEEAVEETVEEVVEEVVDEAVEEVKEEGSEEA